MFILMSSLRYFFVMILAIQIVNKSSLNAARTSPAYAEQEIFKIQDLTVTQKMLFEAMSLNDINLKFFDGNDVRNLILSDLIRLHTITRLSNYLKEKVSQKNLHAILTMINQLFIDCGHDVSVYLLKSALDQANILISNIRDDKNFNMLHCLCLPQYKNWNHCIQIILDAAGAKAFGLIARYHPLHQPHYGYWPSLTPWHSALHYCREDIVDIFMSYAVDDKSKEALLCAKSRIDQRTALHIAAANNLAPISQKLLVLADTVADKEVIRNVLIMTDLIGYTARDLAEDNPKIIDIIKFYCVKYNFEYNFVKFFDFQ